jgi:hypothetical protein
MDNCAMKMKKERKKERKKKKKRFERKCQTGSNAAICTF